MSTLEHSIHVAYVALFCRHFTLLKKFDIGEVIDVSCLQNIGAEIGEFLT